MRAEFLWGNIKERDNLVDLGVEGRIIIKCSVKKYEVKWICLAEERAEGGTVYESLTNHRFP